MKVVKMKVADVQNGNHTVTKTYPSGSTGCTDSGSTTDQTYIRCFVNTYVCECSCPVTGANWKTTWYGGTPCNATRCWNNGGSSGECISPTHTYANPTYTVNQYEKQTWTSTTCVTYASCPNPSCTCSTWSGWSTWSTTTCEEQTNVRECANRTVYY